jgi:LSD1 subclass zinc finger protein
MMCGFCRRPFHLNHAASNIGAAHLKVDALVLFRQESPAERFRVVRRFDLTGHSSQLTAMARTS